MDQAANTQQAATHLPKQWWVFPLFVFLFSRLIILPTAYASQYLLPDDWAVNVTERSAMYPSTGLLGMWVRWDAVWYLSIADIGYDYEKGDFGSTAFFPAYPLIIRLLKPLFGNTVLTGLIIGNALFLISLLVFFRFLYEHITQNRQVINCSLMYLAIYPSAFHFAAPYTESLFLLASLVVIMAAYRQQWWLAGLVGAIASATRIPGVLLMLPVGLEWAAVNGWTLQTALTPQAWRSLFHGFRTGFGTVIMLVITMPLGLFAYMIYLWQKFDAPLAFLDAQQINTNTDYLSFPYNITRLTEGKITLFWVGVIVAVVFAGLTYFVWRRLGAGLASYCLASLLVPVIGSVYTGIPRYSAVLFPVFIVLAFWGQRRWVNALIMIVFSVGLTIFTFLYVQWVLV